jgi:hypothetical protein
LSFFARFDLSEKNYEKLKAGRRQGCQIFLGLNGKKYTKWPQLCTYTKRPQIVPNGHKIYQHFPFKGPPKYTKIGIFGLKINHLATLVGCHFETPRTKNKFSFQSECVFFRKMLKQRHFYFSPFVSMNCNEWLGCPAQAFANPLSLCSMSNYV